MNLLPPSFQKWLLCALAAPAALAQAPHFTVREAIRAEWSRQLPAFTEAQKAALQAEVANKPENMREKIVEGKLSRWAGEQHVLLDQPFVKDDTKTVRQLLQEVNARTGENITIGRFVRFIVGEG